MQSQNDSDKYKIAMVCEISQVNKQLNNIHAGDELKDWSQS